MTLARYCTACGARRTVPHHAERSRPRDGDLARHPHRVPELARLRQRARGRSAIAAPSPPPPPRRYGRLYRRYVTSARSTSLQQLRYDTLVDGTEFAAVSGGIRGFNETLAAWPATLQDRLHARSFFAVPLLQVTTSLFWIVTGVLTLTPASFASATALVIGGGLQRAAGEGRGGQQARSPILSRVRSSSCRTGCERQASAQLLLSAIYLVGLSVVAPELWADHLGPLLKVLPMMAATLVVMAFQEKR